MFLHENVSFDNDVITKTYANFKNSSEKLLAILQKFSIANQSSCKLGQQFFTG